LKIIDFLLGYPCSTFFTLGLAALISLVTTLLNRKFIDSKQLAVWRQEIGRWNAEKDRAKRTGDKKLQAKVKRQEPRILQIQSKTFSQQMKTSLITFIPMLVLWQILIQFYGTNAVAFIPGFGGEEYELPFFMWYLVCMFFVNAISSHITGVGMGMGMGLKMGETE